MCPLPLFYFKNYSDFNHILNKNIYVIINLWKEYQQTSWNQRKN